MNNRKKVLLIILAGVVLLSMGFGSRAVRSARYIKKVVYIVELLTGQIEEEELTVDELIRAFMDKRNPAIYRKYAAEKLGHSKKDPRAVKPLIGVLLDKRDNELIRGEAAFTLGLIGDERAIEPLLQTMNDESYEIQINVLRALNDFRDKRVVEALIPVAKADEDPRKRALAAKGLKIDTPEAVSVLMDLIRNEPGARYVAIETLGETRTKNEEAFQLLLEILNNKKERGLLRKTAAIALGNMGDRRAVEPLIKILKEDKGILYIDAAIALGNLGDKRAIEPLKERVEEDKDEEWIMKDLNEAYRKLTQN